MRCGFYEKEITPPLGQSVPGYFCARPAMDVWDKLYAKAAVFEGDNGIVAVLILDAVQVKKAFCDKVAQRVTEYTGIPADNLVIAATHTHYGIPFGDSFPDDCEFINEPDREYVKVLERLAADTVILAWKRMEECTLSYSMGWEGHAAFCRDYQMKDGTVRTNPSSRRVPNILHPYAGIDPDTPVLMVRNAEGQLKGILFTHTCHQDCVGSYVYSGDYSSVVSKELKSVYGSDFVSIYMAGCCGDINHVDPLGGTRRKYTDVGMLVAGAVKAAMAAPGEAVTGTQVAANRRWVPVYRRKPSEKEMEECRKALAGEEAAFSRDWALSIIGYEANNWPDEVLQPAQILRIGELWLLAFPGEVYHVYGQQARAVIPGEKWLITELSGTESSYMPTPELFGTDIYPERLTDGSFLEPRAGEKMVAAFHEMIREMK